MARHSSCLCVISYTYHSSSTFCQSSLLQLVASLVVVSSYLALDVSRLDYDSSIWSSYSWCFQTSLVPTPASPQRYNEISMIAMTLTCWLRAQNAINCVCSSLRACILLQLDNACMKRLRPAKKLRINNRQQNADYTVDLLEVAVALLVSYCCSVAACVCGRRSLRHYLRDFTSFFVLIYTSQISIWPLVQRIITYLYLYL